MKIHLRRFVCLSIVLSAGLFAITDRARAAGPIGLPAIEQLQAAGQMRPGVRTYQSSSHDRSGGNSDANNYLQVVGSELVLLDEKCPGCVYRFWMTIDRTEDPSLKTLRIYFDGSSTPTVNMNFAQFFGGSQAPFLSPLVGNKYVSSGGYYCYVPMPFSTGCKITVTGTLANFYNITYQRFADATGVTTFTGQEDTTAARNVWNSAGTDPKPDTGTTLITNTINVNNGTTATLANISGGGTIQELEITIPGLSDPMLTSVNLRATWDGAGTPAIDVPFGYFFGCAAAVKNIPGVPVGTNSTTKRMYCYLPMPYGSSALIQLVNNSGSTLSSVNYNVRYTPSSNSLQGAGYLNAKYLQEFPCTVGRDYTILNEAGGGQFIGVVQTMHGPDLSYLEGDERIYVDGSLTPQIHGTGTEDTYNGGYYFEAGPFTLPVHGHPLHVGNTVAVYRYFLSDLIPFTTSIKVGLEHNGNNEGTPEYYSIALYYKSPQALSTLTDTIDVGNGASESAHSYVINNATFSGTTNGYYEGDDDGVLISDDGRRHAGFSQFVAAINSTNGGLLLRRRMDYSLPRQDAQVYIDGTLAGEWYDAGNNGYKIFRDSEFLVPAWMTDGKSSTTIKIVNLSGESNWTEYRYWVYSLVQTAPTSSVSIDMGTTDVVNGLTNLQVGDGNTTPANIGSRDCRRNVNPSVDYYMYFAAADGYAYQGNKPNQWINVDYYDAGTGSLQLQYDGTAGAYVAGPSVTLTNTNTWKTAVWNITDAYFGNRQNSGADFRISRGTGITFYLDKVTVYQKAFTGTAVSIPGTVQAENYDNGGEGNAYHDTTTTNDGGQYRLNEGVDIETTSDTGGGFNVGFAANAEWLNYQVNVATAGAYDITLRVAAPSASGTYHIEMNGVNVTGTKTVPNTGGWQIWADTTVSNITLNAGVQTLKVYMDTGGWNFNSITMIGHQGPYGGTARAIPGIIQAEDYDTGGEGVAYHDLDTANQGGQYRTSEGVDIETTTDTGGGYSVGWVGNGEWLEYTVNVATTGDYAIKLRMASGSIGGEFHLELDGSAITSSKSIAGTGGWQSWTTIIIPGIYMSAGNNKILRFAEETDIGFNINYMDFSFGGADVVSEDLGATNTDDGMTHPQVGDGNSVAASIGGHNCRQNVNPSVDFYMYFAVFDSYAYQGNKNSATITFDYYDSGTGTFTLQYDGTSSSYTVGPSVTLTNTNTWKTGSYSVTDAYFGNRQNSGADFRISRGTGITFYIDTVMVFAQASSLPGLATNPNPANGATLVPITSSLSWTAGSGATSHDVRFGTANPPPFIQNQTATSYTPPTMTPNTLYYWRIDEKNGSGTTTGTVWSFTTLPVPGAASAPNPANGATLVPITSALSWTAGSNASSHDVRFGTANPPPFIQNQAGTSYSPSMSANTLYYWRIDEKNSSGTTTGTVWSFTTLPVPGVASAPNPASGATGVSTSPTLTWTAGSNASSHDVRFGTANPAPFIQNQAGTSYAPGTLSSSTLYYWRIDEKNSSGTTTGTVWSFTTAAGLPTFTNSSFEGGFTAAGGGFNGSVGTGWTPFVYGGVPGNFTFSDETGSGNFDTGAHSQKIVAAAGTEGGVYNQFNTTSGQTYTVTVRVKSGSGAAWCFFGINTSGGIDAHESNGTFYTANNNRSTAWTTFTWTGAATGSKITLFLDTYDGVGYWDTAMVGFKNSGFEGGFVAAGGGFNGNVGNNWTAFLYGGVNSNLTFADETGSGNFDTGAHSQKITAAAGKEGGVYNQIDTVSGQYYRITVRVKSGSPAAWCFMGIDPSGGTNALAGSVVWVTDNNRSTAWTTFTWTGQATGSKITLFLDTYDGVAYWDTATP